MSKQERVVCAAVEFQIDDRRFVTMCLKYKDDPRVKYLRNYLDVYGFDLDENYGETEGFITNKNRFVDPAEALRIALDSRQLEKDVIDRMIHECAITLKPEDLY